MAFKPEVVITALLGQLTKKLQYAKHMLQVIECISVITDVEKHLSTPEKKTVAYAEISVIFMTAVKAEVVYNVV